MYMGGDSVTETKQARALIGSSILGLVLVLSPAVVFGIINPNILNLNVGPDKQSQYDKYFFSNTTPDGYF